MHATLVSTAQLADNLRQWRIFDCRHDLLKPELGAEQYRQAHIPGAAFAHMEKVLSAPKTGKNGRHPLPDPAAFAAWLGEQGLRPGDQAVCYDGGNGSMASRMWWMLRWVGHEAAAGLDGGFGKWTREGRDTTAEVPAYPRTAYPLRLRAGAALEVAAVEQQLAGLFLVDARTPARWRGEQEPIDPEAGRIPGSRNRSSADNVNPDGTFKPPAQLKREFEHVLGSRDPAQVVHYCGSGVSACHNLLALEVAGLPGGKLYAGSWSEWIADPARPREKG